VTAAWIVVAAVGAATVAIKVSGPLLTGSRTLPPRVLGVMDLIPVSVLAALVVTQAFASGERLVLDARAAGLAAAAAALLLRAPVLVVALVAAVAAALVRLLFA
jgi:uncharacterized membrane protein